jgi:hypothetical protein
MREKVITLYKPPSGRRTMPIDNKTRLPRREEGCHSQGSDKALTPKKEKIRTLFGEEEYNSKRRTLGGECHYQCPSIVRGEEI